jgi:uncharacterized protein
VAVHAPATGKTPIAPKGISGWVRLHPVASFFVLTYAISWLAWLPIILGYDGMNTALSMTAQFSPAVAALLVALLSRASVQGWARGILRWRVSPLWYAVALGLPALLIAVQGTAFGLLGYPINTSAVPGLAAYATTVLMLALIAGLGEEPGWRGFALPSLQRRYTPVLATLILGLVWAGWHLPLVFVDPRFPHGFTTLAPQVLLGVLTMIGIALMAFFYTWIYNRTRSVLLCMILHGSFNTATMAFPASFEVLQRSTYVGLLLIQNVTLLLVVVVLIFATRGRLGYGDGSEHDARSKG